MCCTTLLTRGVQHALDLSGCNIQKPHLIVVKFILRRGRTNVHIEIQEFDGGVRATGLLCLLGVGIGLGTFLVYKLYTRLYFKFSSAVDRNFVSSINNQQTGKTLNAETPDSGISSDTQQQQQQQEQQRQQQSENDDASSVNVPSQWRKRIIDWLAKSSFSLEDGDVDEKDNESCDGNVDGKLNRFQLRNKGSKLLDPMLTSFASGWSSGFISNGDNNFQETNNNYVSDDNDDQCLNEGCHDNDDGMMDGINEESEDNEDAVDRDAKHHHHHHHHQQQQQHHHPHHQYSPISDGDHHQQKHHRHSTGSQGAQHHHHVRKHSVGNIQMLSRHQRPHSGRTTSSSRSSDQGGDGWAGNGSRVLRRNCYSFASHKSGDSSLYDYRESLISKGYSIDLGENLDDVVLPDEQAFMSSERLNALDENENDERSDVNGLSKRGAVDHMDRLQYELMKIRMDIDCMNEKFDHLYQGREEQFITFNISNCSPHHLPPLHLQDYPPQHITTTDIVPNYSDPVYNYITDDNKFTDTNDRNNFDDVCDDVSDGEADDDDNNADVDKDFETFDFIWDYHSDLAAINSPGFISNRPLINDNNNRNNNRNNNQINSYNNSYNNSNEFNSILTNMSACDADVTKTSETTLYHDGNQHYGDFSFNDHYNDTTNNNNNNHDDDDDDDDDIFAGKHGGYDVDPEKCGSGKKVLKKMDSSNSDGSCAPPSRTRKESLVLFYMDDDINDNFIIDEDEFFVSPSLFNIKNVANKRSSMHLSFNNQYFPSSHSTPRKLSRKKMAKSTTQLTPKHLNATTQLESDFKKCIARLLQPSTTASKLSAKSTSNNSPRRLKNLQNDKNAEKIKNNGSNNNKNENTSNKNNGDSNNNNNNNNKIFSDDAVRVLGEVRKLFEHLEVDLNVNLTQMSNIRKAYSKIFDICGPINVRAFHSYTYSILAPITYQLLINNQLTLENIGGNFQNVVQHLVAAVDNNHSYLMEWKYKGSVRVPKNEVLFKLINSLKISCEQITAISGMSSLKCRQQYVTSLLNHGVDMECHLVEATKIIICLNVINFFKTHINNKHNDTNDFSIDGINELDNVTNTGDSDGLIFSDVLNNNYHHINNNVNDERDASDRNKFILNDIVKCHEAYSSPELIFKNLINCIQDGYHVDDNGLSLISCLLNIKLQVMKPHKYKSDNDDDNTGDDTFVSTYPHHVAKKDKFVSSVSSLSSSSLSPSSSAPRKIMIIEDKPGGLYCLPVDEDE